MAQPGSKWYELAQRVKLATDLDTRSRVVGAKLVVEMELVFMLADRDGQEVDIASRGSS